MAITIRRVPPEEMLAAHARVRSPRSDSGDRVRKEEPPANIENALALEEGDTLPFRGKSYRVPPVSYADGLRLLQLGVQAEKMSEEGEERLRAISANMAETLTLCWRLAQPRWMQKTGLWRLRPNPFKTASLREVRDILGFFGRYQTISHDRS